MIATRAMFTLHKIASSLVASERPWCYLSRGILPLIVTGPLPGKDERHIITYCLLDSLSPNHPLSIDRSIHTPGKSNNSYKSVPTKQTSVHSFKQFFNDPTPRSDRHPAIVLALIWRALRGRQKGFAVASDTRSHHRSG